LDFFIDRLVLEGLRRRVTVLRRRLVGDTLRVRLRLAALKARQPRAKPILAYFLGSPGFGT